jgi:hypothetical protein
VDECHWACCVAESFLEELPGALGKPDQLSPGVCGRRLHAVLGGALRNVAGVEVELPKQLPVRLVTLQKACVAAVFEANPAGCPAASIVGHAMVITSLLPVPLTGPAYFVSYGGAVFPDLVIVLQGYGVTVDVVADIFIRYGITSSTFKAIPDVPFSSFELVLPEGSYSVLAASGKPLPALVRGDQGEVIGSWVSGLGRAVGVPGGLSAGSPTGGAW